MSLFKRKGVFGSLVIGAQRAAEEKVHIEERRDRFGSLVLGDKGAIKGTNIPQPGSKPVEAGTLSIGKMRELLEINPSHVVALMDQEFARQKETIRKGALELFIEFAPTGISDSALAEAARVRCNTWLTNGTDLAKEADLTAAHTRAVVGPRGFEVPEEVKGQSIADKAVEAARRGEGLA